MKRLLLLPLCIFFYATLLLGQNPPALFVERASSQSLFTQLWWLPGLIGTIWLVTIMRRKGAASPVPKQDSKTDEDEDLSDPGLVSAILKQRFSMATQVGVGGMASVYKGFDRNLDRTVAVKIMHPKLARDPSMRKRFIREAKTLARLEHPGILRIYEVYDDKLPYFTTEFLEGQNLRERMVSGPPMGREEGMSFLIEFASAMAYAHEKGVLHRDLTPNNVIIDTKGKPRIIDFGLARARELTTITKTDQIFGTPDFMAPEVYEGELNDPRSDVYAFGITVSLMLGVGPKIIDVEPIIEGASQSLIDLIKRCYRAEREDRPPSMKAVAAELEHIIGSPKGRTIDELRLIGGLYTLHASCLHGLVNELLILLKDYPSEKIVEGLRSKVHRDNLRRRVHQPGGLSSLVTGLKSLLSHQSPNEKEYALAVELSEQIVLLERLIDGSQNQDLANCLKVVFATIPAYRDRIGKFLKAHTFHLAPELDRLARLAPESIAVRFEDRPPGQLPLLVKSLEKTKRNIVEVLSNVITNAEQAGARLVRVTISRLCDGAYLELVLRDDGPGLDGCSLDELIRRGSSGKGTGTGLPYCQEAILELGGEFRLVDHGKKGTSAYILLPTFLKEELNREHPDG